MHNNRIIGGINEESALKARNVYSSFVKGKMFLTDATTAEMVKLMENTYRDVNISLANELAKIAKNVEIDIWEAIELANKHPRVNIHKPGPGVGGHCLAIDPWFIIEGAPNDAKLIKKSRKINDNMPEFVVQNLLEKLFDINNPKISIFGITYKGNVDDIRESPILDIIDQLNEKNINLNIFDPHVTNCQYYLTNFQKSLNNSDCILIGADHDEFKDIDPEEIKSKMNHKIIFDTKNIIDKEKWENSGFEVYRLGDYSNYDWQKEYGIKEFIESFDEVAAK